MIETPISSLQFRFSVSFLKVESFHPVYLHYYPSMSSHVLILCPVSSCSVPVFVCVLSPNPVVLLCSQMSRSASTFSLSDSAKNSAIVQRSNSLDHPPLRSRVSICVRDPCSPAPNPPPSATSTSARPSPQAATGTGALAGSQSPGLPSSRVSLLLKPAPQAPRTQSNPRFPEAASGHRSPSSSPRSRVPASLRAPHLNLKPTDTARRSVRQAPPAVYQARVSILVPHLTSYARGGNPSGGSGRDAPPADPRKPGPTGPRRETLL